jgi:periplasmic protein TonB
VAVAGESLSDPWPARSGRGQSGLVGAAVALVIHAGLGAAALGIDPARFRAEAPIEIDVEEKLPPPDVKPAPKEPPPPPPERPRLAMKRPAIEPATPPPVAPPPSEEPAKPSDAPPVFGVTMSSVVSGDGPGMAVPVGNTLMAKPGKPAPEAKPLGGDGTKGFTPVAEMYVAEYPKVIFEVNSDSIYPADARRMGMEGTVRLKLGIDEKGNVVSVRVIERAGHEFDEAAAKALKQFKFTPARASDGRAVPFAIPYTYRFTLTQ